MPGLFQACTMLRDDQTRSQPSVAGHTGQETAPGGSAGAATASKSGRLSDTVSPTPQSPSGLESEQVLQNQLRNWYTSTDSAAQT